MGPNERDDTTDPSGDLRAFLEASPSPFHAATEVARRLAAVGSVAVADDARPEGDAIRRGHVVVDGAIVAWVVVRFVDYDELDRERQQVVKDNLVPHVQAFGNAEISINPRYGTFDPQLGAVPLG